MTEDKRFYLPNLHTFRNKNVFYGSFGLFRFRVKTGERPPQNEGEKPIPDLEALCWYGEYCLEESEVVAETTADLDENGYQQILAWLDEQEKLMPRS